MEFAGINYLAILAAAIAAFAVGSIYYGLLGKPWMRAARLDPANVKMSPALFITSYVGDLVMAWVLAGVIGHLGIGQVTVWNGIVSAFFIWLGFIATTLAVNQRYQGFGWDLTLIDAGHWLLAALAMGAVIGAFGV
jgi:Protein of unknown function (DUF1761)